MCSMITRTRVLRAATNNEGQMKFIVNAEDEDDRFMQLVDTGTCGNDVESNSCSYGDIGKCLWHSVNTTVNPSILRFRYRVPARVY